MFLAETRARSYSVKIDRDELARSRVRQFLEIGYVQRKPMEKLRAFVLREKRGKKQSDSNRDTYLLIDNVAYAKTKKSRVSGKSNFPDNQIGSRNFLKVPVTDIVDGISAV